MRRGDFVGLRSQFKFSELPPTRLPPKFMTPSINVLLVKSSSDTMCLTALATVAASFASRALMVSLMEAGIAPSDPNDPKRTFRLSVRFALSGGSETGGFTLKSNSSEPSPDVNEVKCFDSVTGPGFFNVDPVPLVEGPMTSDDDALVNLVSDSTDCGEEEINAPAPFNVFTTFPCAWEGET